MRGERDIAYVLYLSPGELNTIKFCLGAIGQNTVKFSLSTIGQNETSFWRDAVRQGELGACNDLLAAIEKLSRE